MGIKVLRESIAPLLNDHPIIIEAGAHIGRDTLKMSTQWPHATIHAFEPVPTLFEQLVHNTQNYPNVICYPYALGAENCTATMHVSSGRSTATSSLLEPEEYAQEFPDTLFNPQTVNVITLDSWAQQHQIAHVDFMWLDMQGGELAALKAAKTLLATLSVLHIEIALSYRYKNNPLLDEVTTWLAFYGFEPLFTTLIKSTWGNTVFIKKATDQ